MIANESIALEAFARIALRVPQLRLEKEQDEHVDIGITIPVQPGLKHRVWLGFDNFDELHFRVGHLRLEWRPCTTPEVVESYVEEVCGFLAGRFRILEHYTGFGNCHKAILQMPVENGWKTIGTWSTLALNIPWTGTTREIINA